MGRMLPLVAGFSGLGCRVHLHSSGRFRAAVEARGGHLVDIYSRYPFPALDPESVPRSLQHVSYAAEYGEQITAEAARLDPSLIIYESFSPLGSLAGVLLDVPRVCVCAGGFSTPEKAAKFVSYTPGYKVSAKCRRAVARLQGLGLTDATPYYVVHARSPLLNICYELKDFVDRDELEFIEPVLFTTVLNPPPIRDTHELLFVDSVDRKSQGTLKIYIAFGVAIWKTFEKHALETLEKLADAVSHMENVEAVISLGGWKPLAPEASRLARDNVRVEFYVDQWQALREADIFLTHNGLNSTHEAIHCGVPMLSYPFRGDQPARARRCEELGLAVPITDTLRGPVDEKSLQAAVDRLLQARERTDSEMDRLRELQRDLLHAQPGLAGAILERLGL